MPQITGLTKTENSEFVSVDIYLNISSDYCFNKIFEFVTLEEYLKAMIHLKGR